MTIRNMGVRSCLLTLGHKARPDHNTLNNLLGVINARSIKRISKESIKSKSTVDETCNLVGLFRICLFYIRLSNSLITGLAGQRARQKLNFHSNQYLYNNAV